MESLLSVAANQQQPEVNYLSRFSPQLIFLERYTLSVYRAGEIDLFENLDIVHIRLLVEELDPLEREREGGREKAREREREVPPREAGVPVSPRIWCRYSSYTSILGDI